MNLLLKNKEFYSKIGRIIQFLLLNKSIPKFFLCYWNQNFTTIYNRESYYKENLGHNKCKNFCTSFFIFFSDNMRRRLKSMMDKTIVTIHTDSDGSASIIAIEEDLRVEFICNSKNLLFLLFRTKLNIWLRKLGVL